MNQEDKDILVVEASGYTQVPVPMATRCNFANEIWLKDVGSMRSDG